MCCIYHGPSTAGGDLPFDSDSDSSSSSSSSSSDSDSDAISAGEENDDDDNGRARMGGKGKVRRAQNTGHGHEHGQEECSDHDGHHDEHTHGLGHKPRKIQKTKRGKRVNAYEKVPKRSGGGTLTQVDKGAG